MSNLVQVDATRYAKLEEMERKQRLAARRAAVKAQLYVEKAKAANIKVSKAEVEARMKEEEAKKSTTVSPTDASAEGGQM